MISWLKAYFERKAERRAHEKFVWTAEQIELHALGRSDEALSPVMALAGDVVAMWDKLNDDQKNWFRACGDELAENLDRQGFRALLKLNGCYK